MINSDKLEKMLVKMNVEELINYCFSSGYIKKERKCIYCNNYMELKKNNNIKIKLTWRCCYSSCRKYRNRVSILKDSFF
ncbi:hypothetical protein H312_03203 [Anncaliia algerae PRA339]|uniref:Uncharacterized protein n=1 Tax=Anncaliia algerae PRA339 TaxID=1288291 RepID=A0A059EXC1_9MICR|nr:hypothetical protein H312_03203 [Anncaliia algerae PRA339]